MNKISQLLAAMVFVSGAALAQADRITEKSTAPKDWHLLDKTSTGFNGISLQQAYDFLKTTNRKSKKVLVAVIDSGIDTTHEDLKPVLWVNKKEIPGNGKDDDKNGYVDDVYGWNFIGGKDGKNVKEDSYEGARVYHALKAKYENADTTKFTAAQKAEYATYLRAKEKIAGDSNGAELSYMQQILPTFAAGDSIIRKEIGKEKYTAADLKSYSAQAKESKMVKGMMVSISKANNSDEISNEDILGELRGQVRKAESATKAPEEFRKNIVKDNEMDFNDRYYGNADVMASTPFHGTHCAGIIGAARNNQKGIDGVADNVNIMMVRAVPDGDEHDKDIALAIRYAVDNGARVISMSFGKDFSPQKYWVDDAFRYAEMKGVLLIHAAGNDAKNIDTAFNFPNPVYQDGKGRASNVITVGASGDKANGGYTASFSNYGKKEVDVFAPGVQIYSTIPGGNTYGNASGTSMACPVVAGIASLILEYYPEFTPQQVKSIIEKSVTIPTDKVKVPGTDREVELKDISRTGGFVNAFSAVKLADEMSKQSKNKISKPGTINTKRG